MSWLYSRALAEVYLGESSLDGAQFALWSGISTQQQSLPNGKTTASWKPSRYGMTYKPLTDDLGEVVLMSYLADSHARISALPDEAQASTESGAECGGTWRELWTRFDPVSCSWKTHQCLFDEDLDESSVTFPKSGMMRDGVLWERTMWERHTIESESGFWPTPDCQNHRDGTKLRKDNNLMRGGMHGVSLHHAVMWPTPCLLGNGGSHGKAKLKAMLWPTPTVQDSNKATTRWRENHQNNLTAAVNIPTPAARDWKGAVKSRVPGSEHYRGNLDEFAENQNNPLGGRLNPAWVEWLMGWPIGWTDLKPLAMDKYQEWQQQHLNY